MTTPIFDNQADPFAENDEFERGDTTKESHIHIRIQQRNGRKSLTTLQGLPKEYNLKKILKEFKTTFACNGALIDGGEMGTVIQLQGDKRTDILNFLVREGVAKDTIKVHGF